MRLRDLSELFDVPQRVLRRLTEKGIIPAKRLQIKWARWNFARADVEKIRGILLDAGLIEPPAEGEAGRKRPQKVA